MDTLVIQYSCVMTDTFYIRSTCILPTRMIVTLRSTYTAGMTHLNTDFSEFVIADFYQCLSRDSRFGDKRTITTGILLREDLGTFELMTEVGYNL